MPSKLDELKRRAQQTARELDDKYKISSKIDEGTRKTTQALRKGADVATATLDDARQEARRLNREHRITERVSDTARRAANATDEALNKAGGTNDPCMRQCWLRIAENYFYLTRPEPAGQPS